MKLELEKSIYFEALGIESSSEREAYLDQACEGNAELRSGLTALFRENECEDNPVDRPLESYFLSSSLFEEGGEAGMSQFLPGAMVGPYRLVEQIGEGGFGLVFVAEQQEPVRRQVALKIIKPGIEFGHVVSRFRAERQALAMMDHENIARVFDAGVTVSRQPYFVMELVSGDRLDVYCKTNRLGVKERLELFVSICQAVQHAHQKGIIHRDLKPSNVLIAEQDGRAVPKVIDFGLVKAVTQNLAEQTVYTRFAAMMGTPAYMSPEQAEMSNVDIDTRSDIYSLGVMLYELLVGVTPITSQQLSGAPFDDLRRMIREDEPLYPSKRLTAANVETSGIAVLDRRIDVSQLRGTLRGDLDCIVMKALEKNRDRRYSSAAALASDITRYLNQETVEARPPSRWYRFSKFAKRNKAVLWVVTVIASSLMMATTVSIWQAHIAYRAMEEANQSRNQMEDFTRRLKQANSLLITGEAFVQSGEWREAYRVFTDATEMLPEYFSVWVERGSLLARLGLWEEALNDYEKAINLGAPVDGIEFQGVSTLFHYFGQSDMCEELARAHAHSDGGFPGTKLRGQLFGNPNQQEIEKIVQSSESLVRDQSELPSGEPTRSSLMPFGVKLYIAGWAHLRAGDYDKAIVRLNESQDDSVPDWRGLGIGDPLLAITHHHMGQLEEAEQALLASEQSLNQWLDESITEMNGAPRMKWFAWIEFLIHYREAHQLIRGELPPVDPRFELQKQKALAVLAGETARLP